MTGIGLAYADLVLTSPKCPSLDPLAVHALADTGSMFLCVPEHVALQLQLQELERREVTTADGKKQLCAYVGPLEVRFGRRACFVGALVLGDEVLLGAIPMEDMDLVVCPRERTVIVNPASPNFPSAIVK